MKIFVGIYITSWSDALEGEMLWMSAREGLLLSRRIAWILLFFEYLDLIVELLLLIIINKIDSFW